MSLPKYSATRLRVGLTSPLVGLQLGDAILPCQLIRVDVFLLSTLTASSRTGQARSRTLFASRDPLGRHSLMVSRPTPSRPRLMFASASTLETQGWDWEELGCDGLFRISLGSTVSRNVSYLWPVRLRPNAHFQCRSRTDLWNFSFYLGNLAVQPRLLPLVQPRSLA